MISHLLYNAFIAIYGVTIRCFALFNRKAALFIQGRKWVQGRLVALSYSKFSSVVWIHVSSLGEFEQARPIIEHLRTRHELLGIVVTFFSPSGYEVRKDYGFADLVVYLPLDTPSNARRFIRTLKPDIAIFIKYDFWYNHLSEAVKQGVDVIYASVILRKQMVQFNRAKGLYLPLFKKINRFFVQDEHSKTLLEQHGVDQVQVAGDTRFDRVSAITEQPYSDPIIEAFCDGFDIVMFGSAWPSDIAVMQGVMNHYHQFKFIIAPHNVDIKMVEEIQSTLSTKSIRYSELSKPEIVHQRAMIIDNVGMLSKIYRYAKYAYVGGAFQGGLHNTLEPAAYGIPVFFGEHSTNFKFREVMGLLEAGAGFEVQDATRMIQIVTQMETKPKMYMISGGAAKEYVLRNTGGTETIVQYVSELCSRKVRS
ncbi:MAG: glycosyltransferase N-terminal domain-containing protein [Bacteroidota bacterium]